MVVVAEATFGIVVRFVTGVILDICVAIGACSWIGVDWVVAASVICAVVTHTLWLDPVDERGEIAKTIG